MPELRPLPLLRRLPLLLAFALACVAGGDAWADEHGTRVAIIEMGRIGAQASALRSVGIQVETQRMLYADDARREEERLRAFRDEITRQETLLAPAALEERRRTFDAEVAAFQRKTQERTALLTRVVRESEAHFREALGIVVAEVAAQENIDIVLPMPESLFTKAGFNLTDLVIERLNETFPEIPVSFDEN